MDNLYNIYQMVPGPTGQFISGSNSEKCEAERIRKLYMLPGAIYGHPQYEIRVIGFAGSGSGVQPVDDFLQSNNGDFLLTNDSNSLVGND